MRALLRVLLAPALVLHGQSPAVISLDLRTALETEPAAGIQLAPRGCWDGLLLGAARPLPSPRRGAPGATVEVWDLAYRPAAKAVTFGAYLDSLRERLSQGLAAPPPTHGEIELGEFMYSDPSRPQLLDLTKAKSMQNRFNRLPPNGSPARP